MGRLSRDWVAGMMLLVVGLLLLGERLFPDLVPFVPLALGLALLGVFLLGRSAGALVNGSVTVGIGVGVLVVKGGNPDFGAAGFIISVAGGFYLAWVLGLIFNIPSVRWWPIVPGSLLLALGAVVYTAKMGKPLVDAAVDWWPALLAIMGVYLLFHARLRARLAVDDETSTIPTGVAGGLAVGSTGVTHPTPAVQPAAGAAHPSGAPQPTGRPLSDATGGQFGGDRPGSVERT